MATRIGVLSDTHGGLSGDVVVALDGCNLVIHAGDFGGRRIVERLKDIASLTAVLGNCDIDDFYRFEFGLKHTATLLVEGVEFFIAHRPQKAIETMRSHLHGSTAGTGAFVCVHGHTHVPRNEQVGDTYLLCPGSPTEPRGGSQPTIMLLQVENGAVLSIEEVTV